VCRHRDEPWWAHVHSPEELRKSVVPKAGGWKHEIDIHMIKINK
jgi:hypothetical protein